MPTQLDTTYGDWELLEALSDSPLASSVYLCRHRVDSQRRAVLKFYWSEQLDQCATELLRELENLKGLRHPNLAKVEEYDLYGPPPRWMAMEHVAGPTLDDVLEERGALPLTEALRLALDLSQGLSALHERRCWHRDVRPENLRLGASGALILVDLGSCAELGGYYSLDCPLDLETLRYGPPELAHPQDVDPTRWDLYGLGACLWRGLTGRVPYMLEGSAGDAAHRKSRLISAKARADALDPGPRFDDDLRGLVRELTAPRPPASPLQLARIQEQLRTLLKQIEQPRQGYWLICENGDGSTVPLKLAPGENVIGRGADVEVNLGIQEIDEPLPTVSHRHAVLSLDGDVLSVSDLGSKNGTTVNGRPVAQNERIGVHPGDVIGVGRLRLRLNMTS